MSLSLVRIKSLVMMCRSCPVSGSCLRLSIQLGAPCWTGLRRKVSIFLMNSSGMTPALAYPLTSDSLQAIWANMKLTPLMRKRPCMRLLLPSRSVLQMRTMCRKSLGKMDGFAA